MLHLLMIIIFKEGLTFKRVFLITIPIIILGYILLSNIIMEEELLTRRFTTQDMDYQDRTTSMRFHFIGIAAEEFLRFPFGKGRDAQIIYNQRTTLVHNQYLTYILAGGVLSLIGVVLLFKGLWVIIRKFDVYRSNENKKNIIISAISISVFTFFITLFTIESSSLFFFFNLSLAIYLLNNLKTST